jgi:hypothetical protein
VNFYFSSRPTWAALLISLPWLVLFLLDSINPHRNWSGIPCALSGLASLALLAYSWSRGERQMLFLLVVFVIAALAVMLPLFDVRNLGHILCSSHSLRSPHFSRGGLVGFLQTVGVTWKW